MPLTFTTPILKLVVSAAQGPRGLPGIDGAGAVILTRTAAQNNPNIPTTLTVTGITTPGASNPLVLTRVTDANGYPRWEFGDFIMTWGSGDWELAADLGNDYLSRVASTALTPVGLTFDAPTVGAGTPIVVGVGATPAALNQTCLVGGPVSTNRVPFRAISITPPIWQIDGPFAKNTSSPLTYDEIGSDGLAVTIEPYPLS